MRLFRRRLIPDEIVELRDDEVLFGDEEMVVTKWHTLKPKLEFSHGASCCFVKEGYKVGKVYTHENEFLRYYCDIVSVSKGLAADVLIITDLLVDVIVEKDGSVRVDDLDQVVVAHKSGLLLTNELHEALDATDRLLKIIYRGDFGRLTRYIDDVWEAEKPLHKKTNQA